MAGFLKRLFGLSKPEKQDSEGDDPIDRLLTLILDQSLKVNAEKVDLQKSRAGLQVIYVIDGERQEQMSVPLQQMVPLMAAVAGNAAGQNQDIKDLRWTCDGEEREWVLNFHSQGITLTPK